MQAQLENIQTLLNVRRTCLEMLNHRHYVIPDKDLHMTLREFRELYCPRQVEEEGELEDDANVICRMSRESMVFFTHRDGDPDQKICVFFPSKPKLGIPDVKLYFNELVKENAKRCIIVLRPPPRHQTGRGISATAAKALRVMGTKGFIIETFEEKELRFNITKHSLVPKHIPLGEDQKLELLRRYRLEETKLPKMLHSDPVARYFGMERGSVFKIVRPSETAGRYVTYRIVV